MLKFLSLWLQRANTLYTNEYLSKYHHGLQWYNGAVSLRYMKHLRENKEAAHIHPQGSYYSDAQIYLKSALSMEVINLEGFITPTYQEIFSKYSNILLCPFHRNHDNRSIAKCSINQVYLHRKWMRGLIRGYDLCCPKEVCHMSLFRVPSIIMHSIQVDHTRVKVQELY